MFNANYTQLAQAHIVELEKRIESLREMADTLQELVSCCAGDERPDCPILAELERPEEGDAKSQLQPGMTSVFRSMASAGKLLEPGSRLHGLGTAAFSERYTRPPPEMRSV